MRNVQTQKGLPNLLHTLVQICKACGAGRANINRYRQTPLTMCGGRSTVGP